MFPGINRVLITESVCSSFMLNYWNESLHSFIVVSRMLYYLLKREFRFLTSFFLNDNIELEVENCVLLVFIITLVA